MSSERHKIRRAVWAATWLVVPLCAWNLVHRASTAVPLWRVNAASLCQPVAPRLWMGTERPSPPTGTAWVLATNGLLSQTVCQPGTLSFTARGTPAEGLYPLMTVSLNGHTLLTTRVGAAQPFRLNIKQAGEVAVAFHDDRHLPEHVPPEDRNLFVQDWRFSPLP